MKFGFRVALLSAIVTLPTVIAALTLPALAQDMAQPSDRSTLQDLNVLENGYLRRRGHQTYEFRGQAHQTVTIALTSRQFDTYLELYDTSGRLIARNDDTDGSTNSTIRLTLPSSGTYTVVARGKNASQQGTFALAINSHQPQPSPTRPTPAPRREATQETGTIQTGQVLYHRLAGQAGETVIISLNSNQFDPFLTLEDATGRVIAENDDAGGTTNSKIRVTLPQTGAYRVGVRGLNRGDAGQYTLNIQSGDIEPPTTSPGRIGDRHTNHLFRGETLQHTFEANAGDSVTLSLQSHEFDPYLTLFGPDGRLIAENDDADNTNSRIALRLPSTGVYTAEVRGFNADAQGEYTLTIAR